MSYGTPEKARAAENARRKRDLAKLHIAQKELAITDDDCKKLIGRVSRGRSTSRKDLCARERAALLAEFIRLGWRPKNGGDPVQQPVKPKTSKQARYLEHLWREAAKLGAAHCAGMQGLQRMVCAVNHLSMQVMPTAGLAPFSAAELSATIEAVKSMIKRVE